MNIDISVTIRVFYLKLSVYVLEVLLKRIMSYILNLGLSCYFMSNDGKLFDLLKT